MRTYIYIALGVAWSRHMWLSLLLSLSSLSSSLLSLSSLSLLSQAHVDAFQWHAQSMHNWQVHLNSTWDVLGPFPISAREQHLIAPSFPLDLTQSQSYQHQPNRHWSSSLPDNGTVTWKSFHSVQNRLLVSHPEIRWDYLRAAEGWAALQHHNILRTTLKISPPSQSHFHPFPWLSFSIKQASFFTLIPHHPLFEQQQHPQWYPGNIYAFTNSPKQLVKPPQLSSTEPTYYHLFVSGDYEIRLFGDPKVNNHPEPVLDIQIDVSIQPIQQPAILEPHLHVIPDLWQGWFFGSTIGIAICVLDAQWSVIDVKSSLSALQVSLHHHQQRIISTQTRLIPIVVHQSEPIQDEILDIELVLENISTSQAQTQTLITLVSHIHLHHWTNHSNNPAIRATYILAGSPTQYMAIPPTSLQSVSSPIVAIHGAGVEVTSSFWVAALHPQSQSWIIFPSGRTSWGLDWHGTSADDVWCALAALMDLLEALPFAKQQLAIDRALRPILIGHSNGGQGTWYLASRYPDKIRAAIPAAGYIKSQQYVSLSLSRGSHFLDASRIATSLAALTPDDNDLFMSNIVDMPILAIHGGADENVPVWHTRELVSLVKSWNPDAPISLYEEPNQPHWYPTIFSSRRFLEFLNTTVVNMGNFSQHDVRSFTLTVANPQNSGSFHGVSIRQVIVPGRLARLHVTLREVALIVETKNVFSFTLDTNNISVQQLRIDGDFINVESCGRADIRFKRRDTTWEVSGSSVDDDIRPMGPISNILSSTSPLTIVTSANTQTESVGKRIAHAMFEYFRLDVSLITDEEAMNAKHINGNIIVLGADNIFGLHILPNGQEVVRITPTESIKFRNKVFKFGNTSSTGMLFLHPHPSSSTNLVLFLVGTDDIALERAARVLLPIRTGVPLPEFVILGPNTDFQAAGGLQGSGFWNRSWGWNEEMAWLD